MTTLPINAKNSNLSQRQRLVVELERVGKSYSLPKEGGRMFVHNSIWALNEISFCLYQGETLGIVGRNGAGKTTLLNIMAGVLSPNVGRIKVEGRVVSLFNLGIGFQDELSGRENIYLNASLLGASRNEIETKLADILDFSELGSFIEMPLGSYSQGMRLRLAFSIVANLNFDILILDEILAVGDVLFQDKCLRHLVELKQKGKTIIFTTQSMELIERLSDKALLLEHGKLVFMGAPGECIRRYRQLLTNEAFFVGLPSDKGDFFENTKKWTEDFTQWGKVLGTQEAEIEKVVMFNRDGQPITQLEPGGFLKIRVEFAAKATLKNPHLGIAIFREDGAYVYGPNTNFDGIRLDELKSGRYWMELDFFQVNIAPGRYRLSIAIWDKDECLPYCYHCARYPLLIIGENKDNALSRVPFRLKNKMFFWPKPKVTLILQDELINFFSHQQDAVDYDSRYAVFKLLKVLTRAKRYPDKIFTAQPLELYLDFEINNRNRNQFLWLGIFREDLIFCQGNLIKYRDFPLSLTFPSFDFLCGTYFLSFGIWNTANRRFLSLHHGQHKIKVLFDRPDHGTVYLRHLWRFSWQR